MNTLIIVDAQIDFMPNGSLEVPDGDAIVPVINQVSKQFDLVVATQDWHPQNHMSFASNHEGHEPFEEKTINGMDQILWPDHCVQGTDGAKIHPAVDLRRAEAIIRKGMNPAMDSYSGFYDNGHDKSTGLAGYLREKGAEKIYFCGLAADICVYFTIKDALKEGFKTALITDATRPLESEKFEKQLSELKSNGVELIESSAFNS